MLTSDDFSTYVADLLSGTYDCVDRISLRGYFPVGQTSGGLLTWWNQLFPNTELSEPRLRKLYAARKAAYDLRKLRGKSLVERIGKTRRYRVRRPGIRTLAALLILREQVIKPVLAGVCRPKRGRPPKNLHPLDVHYQKLQCEMLATLQTLKIAA